MEDNPRPTLQLCGTTGSLGGIGRGSRLWIEEYWYRRELCRGLNRRREVFVLLERAYALLDLIQTVDYREDG